MSGGFAERVPEVPRFAPLRAATADLPGWLHEDVGPILHRYARDVAPGAWIVDVDAGTKAAVWLAAGLADRGHGRLARVGAVADGDEALIAACRVAGVDAVVERVAGEPEAAGLAWNHGVAIGLLHLGAHDDYATLCRRFEVWSRFLTDDGLLVIDGVGQSFAPSRLVTELPGWFHWSVNTFGKWVFRKRDPQYLGTP